MKSQIQLELKLLRTLLRSFRGLLALAVTIGLLSGASGAGLVAVINVRLAQTGDGPAWLYIGLVAVVLVSHVASQRLLIRLAQGTSFDLRMQLCRQMLATSLRRLEELGAGRLMAILTEDVPAIIAAFLTIPALCINLATMVVCLFYLGYLSPTLLLLVFAFIGLGVAVRHRLAAKGLRSLREARTEASALMKHYRALTEGAKELKLHDARRADFLEEVLRNTAAAMRRHNVSGLTAYTLAESWSRLTFYAFLGLMLFALPGVQSLSPATLIGYTLTVVYVMGPLGALLNLVPTIGRARIALQNVQELNASLLEAPDAPPRESPAPGWSHIELAGVTHSYRKEGEEAAFTLGPITLAFGRGEIVFLVGGNGSGKTTLAKLLTGLYAPESGGVYVDGRLIGDEERERYRQYFTVIFADFFLFDRLMGLRLADLDERAAACLERLRLHRQVRVENGVFSTTSLSFGQRKRLALLTAYLEDRPFCVFDEWAAGQDPVFKEFFYTELLTEMKRRGKTVLVISHDEKYFGLADRLIRLEDGLVEDADAAPVAPGLACVS